MLTVTTQLKLCDDCGSTFVVEDEEQTRCRTCTLKAERKAPTLPVVDVVDVFVKPPIVPHGPTEPRRVKQKPVVVREPKPKKPTRACANCSGEFIPKSRTAKYCSPSCAYEANRLKREAEVSANAEARKRIADSRADTLRVAGCTHWHFRTNGGAPTTYYPTRRVSGDAETRAVIAPVDAHPRDLWDQYVADGGIGVGLVWRNK